MRDALDLLLMGLCKLTPAHYCLHLVTKQFHFSKLIPQIGCHIFFLSQICAEMYIEALFVFIKDEKQATGPPINLSKPECMNKMKC